MMAPNTVGCHMVPVPPTFPTTLAMNTSLVTSRNSRNSNIRGLKLMAVTGLACSSSSTGTESSTSIIVLMYCG